MPKPVTIKRKGVNVGEIIPINLPMLAAVPVPVPLKRVGYNSGVYVYKAAQAPRLKKEITMLHSMIQSMFTERPRKTLPIPAINK